MAELGTGVLTPLLPPLLPPLLVKVSSAMGSCSVVIGSNQRRAEKEEWEG